MLSGKTFSSGKKGLGFVDILSQNIMFSKSKKGLYFKSAYDFLQGGHVTMSPLNTLLILTIASGKLPDEKLRKMNVLLHAIFSFCTINVLSIYIP